MEFPTTSNNCNINNYYNKIIIILLHVYLKSKLNIAYYEIYKFNNNVNCIRFLTFYDYLEIVYALTFESKDVLNYIHKNLLLFLTSMKNTKNDLNFL